MRGVWGLWGGFLGSPRALESLVGGFGDFGTLLEPLWGGFGVSRGGILGFLGILGGEFWGSLLESGGIWGVIGGT